MHIHPWMHYTLILHNCAYTVPTSILVALTHPREEVCQANVRQQGPSTGCRWFACSAGCLFVSVELRHPLIFDVVHLSGLVSMGGYVCMCRHDCGCRLNLCMCVCARIYIYTYMYISICVWAAPCIHTH